MKIIYNKIFLEHDTRGLPESKERLEAFSGLKDSKILNGEKYLELVHRKEYIDFVKNNLSFKRNKYLDYETFLSKKSYQAACFAVGATIMASEKNDFALVRPPGHHATFAKGRGFCVFNNMAIAVKKLVDEGKRVAILDFDGHYGDGTAEIFYNSDKVLHASFHQFPAYPARGKIEQIGEGKGKGFNISVPLVPRLGDDMFLYAMERILFIFKQFKPDTVGVSAGFDGHWADPLLQLELSANAYYRTGKLLSKFKNVFGILEGGYNTNYLPKCVHNFIAGVNKKKVYFDEGPTFSKGPVKAKQIWRMNKIKKTLIPYWKWGKI